MNIGLLLVLLTLSSITFVLIMGWADIAMTIFAGLLFLMLTGVITVTEGLAGFSNQGMLTIALLYVMANAVRQTGVLDKFSHHLLGTFTGSYSRSLARIGLPVSAISALMNNTPVVALLIPVVKTWCRSNGIPASKFLLPISYFTIVGGTCTLIGTSTTLIIHGMLLESGDVGLSFFEPMKIGGVLVLVALLYIIFIGYRLLPSNEDNIVALDHSTRDFVVTLKVKDNFKNLNQSIEAAGLRKLSGLYLFQIERKGEFITAVEPEEVIRMNDRLFFTGVPDTILELQKREGLELMNEEGLVLGKEGYRCFEAVISNGSPLLGKLVRNSNFRELYDAVILAVHRHGQRLQEKIGDVVLKEGDTLLLLGKPNFAHKWYHSKDFLLVSEAEDFEQKSRRDIWIILSCLLGMIVLAVSGMLPMFLAAALAVAVLFLFKVVTILDAVKSMNWKVLLVIAAAFGISKAVANVGIPEYLGYQLIHYSGSLGFVGVLAAIVLGTMLLSEFVNNAAAAAILFPIVHYLSVSTGYSLHALALALLFGATSSFSTPVGYQTNMMVQGPGNYAYKDYIKIGLPLNIISGVVSTAMLYFWFK